MREREGNERKDERIKEERESGKTQKRERERE